MKRFRRTDAFRPKFTRFGWLLLAIPLVGCHTGISSNPFKIGNLPTNDIVRTHAKPAMRGYYHNFDPAARTLTMTPLRGVNQVGTQHVLIATVCDRDGNGRRNRRVEWHVSGAGHLVEVDESGLFPGRGYMVDDHYAVSYTNYRSHVLTRGTEDPSDDIHLKPGQSWCVITSPVAGDTHVTCYAPGIHNWEKHKVFAVKHWVDAVPCFPPSSVNHTGQPHSFTTRLTRGSDGTPAAGYPVRYRILSGPPAVLLPGSAQQVVVLSDPNGAATVELRQTQAIPGINVLAIDVLRPKDKPSDREVVVASRTVTKTWVSPRLAVQKLAPPTAVVGQQIPYRIVVTNTGSVATRGVTIRDTLPGGLQFVGSTPPAARQGNLLYWSFAALQPGQSAEVQFTTVATMAGRVTNCANAVSAEGIVSEEACAITEVTSAALVVSKQGPRSAVVGQPCQFRITVTNRGNAPASNVMVTDSFDPAFAHETGTGAVQMPIGALAPGQSQSVTINLTPRNAGRLCNRVDVTADGGLTATAEDCVEVAQPQLSVVKRGPAFAFTGASVDYEIVVRNAGQVPVGDLLVQDQVPQQLRPVEASDGGTIQGSLVTWRLGPLGPNQERTVTVRSLAIAVGKQVRNDAVAMAGDQQWRSDPVFMEIKGVSALLTEVIDDDMVAVGGETAYTVQITNQGSLPAHDVILVCTLGAEFEFVAAESDPAHETSEDGRTITFEPFVDPQGGGMAPGKALRYRIIARAVKPGDSRFVASVTSREKPVPIVKQESTTVYDPNTGEMGEAAKPAPNADGQGSLVSAQARTQEDADEQAADGSEKQAKAPPTNGAAPREISEKSPAPRIGAEPRSEGAADQGTRSEVDQFQIPSPPITDEPPARLPLLPDGRSADAALDIEPRDGGLLLPVSESIR